MQLFTLTGISVPIPEVNSESKLSAFENMSTCSYMKRKDNPTASSDK